MYELIDKWYDKTNSSVFRQLQQTNRGQSPTKLQIFTRCREQVRVKNKS